MPDATTPPGIDKSLPAWSMPADLMTIVKEDGEWEDPTWDPLLLTVVGDTRFEGRLIPVAWQMSLWPSDVFFKGLDSAPRARGEKIDGQTWSAILHKMIEANDPALFRKLQDDSDASTCVIWVETEIDGRRLMECVWNYLHALKTGVEML